MTARIDHGTASGTFSLDGETHEVENNLWVVGDDTECVVIDAPHDVDAIMGIVGDRRVTAIVCTHATTTMSGSRPRCGSGSPPRS